MALRSRSKRNESQSAQKDSYMSSGTEQQLPTPHYDKLKDLLVNQKLPESDKERIETAIEHYNDWINAMNNLQSTGDDRVRDLVETLNEYKLFLELEVIWDSPNDFLYRQRGQLKLDSSVIEEFLPRLVDPKIIPGLEGKTYLTGPHKTFSAVYFATGLAMPAPGAGLQIRTKDHDFTVGRPVYLQASYEETFPPGDTVTHDVYLAFIAAECKTNLDKTMFQEAAATAHDLKVAIQGARYYLLCEWLDMTPISSATTDIDEVIVLRGKRIPSTRRENYASYNGRKIDRHWYMQYLKNNPVRPERILRFVEHMRNIFDMTDPDEEDVLAKGYF